MDKTEYHVDKTEAYPRCCCCWISYFFKKRYKEVQSGSGRNCVPDLTSQSIGGGPYLALSASVCHSLSFAVIPAHISFFGDLPVYRRTSYPHSACAYLIIPAPTASILFLSRSSLPPQPPSSLLHTFFFVVVFFFVVLCLYGKRESPFPPPEPAHSLGPHAHIPPLSLVPVALSSPAFIIFIARTLP